MRSTYTFAISIPRFSARYSHISAQCSDRVQDRYEIIGVDSRNLTISECIAPEIKEWEVSPSQVACAMSHLAAYRRIVELDLPSAFVVEDDAVLPADIENIIAECLPHLSDRGVISLYSPRPHPVEYSKKGAPVLSGGQLLAPTERINIHTGTAYLISRSAAADIISYNWPIRHLADHWFAFYAAGAVDKVLLYYPMPVSVSHHDSTIGYDSKLRGMLKALAFRFPPIRRAINSKRSRVERQSMANIMIVDAPTFYERQGTEKW